MVCHADWCDDVFGKVNNHDVDIMFHVIIHDDSVTFKDWSDFEETQTGFKVYRAHRLKENVI